MCRCVSVCVFPPANTFCVFEWERETDRERHVECWMLWDRKRGDLILVCVLLHTFTLIAASLLTVQRSTGRASYPTAILSPADCNSLISIIYPDYVCVCKCTSGPQSQLLLSFSEQLIFWSVWSPLVEAAASVWGRDENKFRDKYLSRLQMYSTDYFLSSKMWNFRTTVRLIWFRRRLNLNYRLAQKKLWNFSKDSPSINELCGCKK